MVRTGMASTTSLIWHSHPSAVTKCPGQHLSQAAVRRNPPRHAERGARDASGRGSSAPGRQAASIPLLAVKRMITAMATSHQRGFEQTGDFKHTRKFPQIKSYPAAGLINGPQLCKTHSSLLKLVIAKVRARFCELGCLGALTRE